MDGPEYLLIFKTSAGDRLVVCAYSQLTDHVGFAKPSRPVSGPRLGPLQIATARPDFHADGLQTSPTVVAPSMTSTPWALPPPGRCGLPANRYPNSQADDSRIRLSLPTLIRTEVCARGHRDPYVFTARGAGPLLAPFGYGLVIQTGPFPWFPSLCPAKHPSSSGGSLLALVWDRDLVVTARTTSTAVQPPVQAPTHGSVVHPFHRRCTISRTFERHCQLPPRRIGDD